MFDTKKLVKKVRLSPVKNSLRIDFYRKLSLTLIMLSKSVTLALFAILSVSALIIIEPAEANPASYMQLIDNDVITVLSPQDGATYNTTTLPLYFTIETNNQYQPPTRYILNSQSPVNVSTFIVSKTSIIGSYSYGGSSNNNSFSYPRYLAQGTAVLNNLSNGKYNLTVERYRGAANPQGIEIINSTKVSFTIDTSNQNATSVLLPPQAPYPILTLYSSQNNKVPIGDTPYASVYLSFNLNVIPSWVGYSLDGDLNTTIPIDLGSLYSIYTSIHIPLGNHSLTFYANDTAGNWAAPQTVCYNVIPANKWARFTTPIFATKTSNISPISTITIGALVASFITVFIIVSLLFLRRHRKTAKAS